jgi:8-oxo-dGTP pyrophosphatase MutT (NUDIX family)
MPISEYMKALRDKVGKNLLLMPSAAAAVFDGEGRVLLVQSTETGKWMIPGGSVDPQEQPADTAVRELWEETGLLIELTALVGVYGGPELHVRYPNGDEVAYIMTLFAARIAGGSLKPDGSEISEARFFSPSEFEQLELVRATKQVLNDVRRFDREALFEKANWSPAEEGKGNGQT